MEVKLNTFEKILMRFGDGLLTCGRKVMDFVYKNTIRIEFIDLESIILTKGC